MRLNYYRFPENVDAHTRYINGAECLGGVGKRFDRDDVRVNDRNLGYCTEAEYTIGGITVTTAKKLLKQFGGSAWTEHCERDGGVFEVTDIVLKGNNSKFQYNHHL